MDCDEPDVPMVEICGYKPKCRLTNNVFCNDIRSMRFFLHAFSAMKHDKHCLSFAFTYREMSDFQGIAWIKVKIAQITEKVSFFNIASEASSKEHSTQCLKFIEKCLI